MTDSASQTGPTLLFQDEPVESTPNGDNPEELTDAEGAATGDTPLPVEETEVEELDEPGDPQDEDDPSEDDETTEAEDPEAETEDEETELYLDLDGEEVSLETVRKWKKLDGLEAKFTQQRQEDARREKRNISAESRNKDQTQRVDAIVQEAEAFIETMKSQGYYSEEDISKLATKVESMRTGLNNDQAAAKETKTNNEVALWFKRNKSWLDDDGNITEQFDKDKKVMEDYLSGEGFTPQEMADITGQDHRFLIAIHKAAKFDNLNRKIVDVKKKVRKAPLKSKPKAKPKAAPAPKSAEERIFGSY